MVNDNISPTHRMDEIITHHVMQMIPGMMEEISAECQKTHPGAIFNRIASFSGLSFMFLAFSAIHNQQITMLQQEKICRLYAEHLDKPLAELWNACIDVMQNKPEIIV